MHGDDIHIQHPQLCLQVSLVKGAEEAQSGIVHQDIDVLALCRPVQGLTPLPAGEVRRENRDPHHTQL